MKENDYLPEYNLVVRAYREIKEHFGEAKDNYFSYLLPVSYASDSGEQVPIGVNEFQGISQIGSYKLFGAFVKICEANRNKKNGEQKINVAASAGNHAQGVALACNKLGLQGVIFMPEATPIIKIIGTLRHGGENVTELEKLEDQGATAEKIKQYCNDNFDKFKNVKVRITGKNFDEASAAAKEFASSPDKEFIPPFDSKYVIAAAGTWGLNIIEKLLQYNYNSPNYEKQEDFTTLDDLMKKHPLDWDDVVKNKISQLYGEGGKDLSLSLPVGGGGLAAGVSLVIRKLAPKAELIAVSLEGTPSLPESIIKDEVVKTPPVPLLYKDGSIIPGGTKVARIGDTTFEVIKRNFDKVVTVGHDAFFAATANNLVNRESMSEPQAGATQVASANIGSRPVRISFKSGENLSDREIEIITKNYPAPRVQDVVRQGAIIETVILKQF